jgi:hypothetical protein
VLLGLLDLVFSFGSIRHRTMMPLASSVERPSAVMAQKNGQKTGAGLGHSYLVPKSAVSTSKIRPNSNSCASALFRQTNFLRIQRTTRGQRPELRTRLGPDIVDLLVGRFGDGISGQSRVPGEFGRQVTAKRRHDPLSERSRRTRVLAKFHQKCELPHTPREKNQTRYQFSASGAPAASDRSCSVSNVRIELRRCARSGLGHSWGQSYFALH